MIQLKNRQTHFSFKSSIIAGIVAIFLLVGSMSVYTVDETEQVLITLFGKVRRVAHHPGLHFQVPFFERTIVYPRNFQQWISEPGQIPTKDKTYISVESFGRWKIVDPLLFFKTIGADFGEATLRLDEIIDSSVRNVITSHSLIESLRNKNRVLDSSEAGLDDDSEIIHQVLIGRSKIENIILQQAKGKLVDFGIELFDIKIKQIEYIESVRNIVYERMIAERKQIGARFRAEGKGEAQSILGDKELELNRIQSEAYRISEELKGKAEAEATRLYAKAFNHDPEFYTFVKTLEIYTEALDKNSSLVLSTDSELLKYLKTYTAP